MYVVPPDYDARSCVVQERSLVHTALSRDCYSNRCPARSIQCACQRTDKGSDRTEDRKADERPAEGDKMTSEWRTPLELDGQGWAGQGAEADQNGTGRLCNLGRGCGVEKSLKGAALLIGTCLAKCVKVASQTFGKFWIRKSSIHGPAFLCSVATFSLLWGVLGDKKKFQLYLFTFSPDHQTLRKILSLHVLRSPHSKHTACHQFRISVSFSYATVRLIRRANIIIIALMNKEFSHPTQILAKTRRPTLHMCGSYPTHRNPIQLMNPMKQASRSFKGKASPYQL